MSTTDPNTALDPRKNPSYPQRVHLAEKPRWQDLLRTVEARLAVPLQKLSGLEASDAKRPAFEKLYAQMQGSRDQVADAVKRLPLETGGLYEEDHHRIDNAVEALDRLFQKWDNLTSSR